MEFMHFQGFIWGEGGYAPPPPPPPKMSSEMLLPSLGIFLNEPLTSTGTNSFCVMLFFFRLSLKREPDGVVVRKYKDPSGAKSQLRTSKSHEDLLTPFTSCSMDSISNSTYGTHSDSKIWTPQPHHRPLASRHSLQVERHSGAGMVGVEGSHVLAGTNHKLSDGPRSGHWIQFKVEDSPVPPRGRKTSTLPVTRGGSFSSSHSATEIRRRRSDSEHDPSLRQGKTLAIPTPLQAAVVVNSRANHSAPVAVRGRHKKSHSLGTK